MTGQGKLLTGVVVGAGAMYLLDPECGARRRSLLRDQGMRVRHRLGDGLAAAAREVRSALGLELLSRAATNVLPRRPVELGTGARSIEAKFEEQTSPADAEPVPVGEMISSAPARKSSTKSSSKIKSTTRRRRPRE